MCLSELVLRSTRVAHAPYERSFHEWCSRQQWWPSHAADHSAETCCSSFVPTRRPGYVGTAFSVVCRRGAVHDDRLCIGYQSKKHNVVWHREGNSCFPPYIYVRLLLEDALDSCTKPTLSQDAHGCPPAGACLQGTCAAVHQETPKHSREKKNDFRCAALRMPPKSLSNTSPRQIFYVQLKAKDCR